MSLGLSGSRQSGRRCLDGGAGRLTPRRVWCLRRVHSDWAALSPVLGSYRLRYAPPLPPSSDTLDSADWSKACLLHTLKCGQSGVGGGVEGRERKGVSFLLCFFVYTFPRFLCSWDFSFLLYGCPKQECIAFEPLVSWFNNRLICMIRVI